VSLLVNHSHSRKSRPVKFPVTVRYPGHDDSLPHYVELLVIDEAERLVPAAAASGSSTGCSPSSSA
jgi:hypothetical protein